MSITKADAIRSVIADGITKHTKVAEEVQLRYGMHVTAAHVSTQKLTDSKKNIFSKAVGRRGSSAHGMNLINQLLIARDAVIKIGGIEATRETLDALEKLLA